MDKQPQCKHYVPISPNRRYCGNCAKGLGIWCDEYLEKHSEYYTTQKFKALDMMMRQNKGIKFPE